MMQKRYKIRLKFTIILAIILTLLISCSPKTSGGIKSSEEKKQAKVLTSSLIDIVSLKFYLAGNNGLDAKLRVYNDTFNTPSKGFVWYELILTNKNYGKSDNRIELTEVWLKKDGSVVSKLERDLGLFAEEEYLEFCGGIKSDWKQGEYILKIMSGQETLITKEFEIK